jgi:hypothetical protein
LAIIFPYCFCVFLPKIYCFLSSTILSECLLIWRKMARKCVKMPSAFHHFQTFDSIEI